MNRFKNYITAAISGLVIVTMGLAAGAGEAKAGVKAPRRASPPARPAAPGIYSYYHQANSGAQDIHHRTNPVWVGAGDINGDRRITSRRSRILPYLEQGNIYRLKRP